MNAPSRDEAVNPARAARALVESLRSLQRAAEGCEAVSQASHEEEKAL
jgi:hypothetical protein